MKSFAVFFLLFAALQVALVYGKTIADILEDFQPVFDKIHYDVGQTQSQSHKEEGMKRAAYSRFVAQELWSHEKVISYIYEKTQNEMKHIIDETGMTGHEDKIEHCFTKELLDFSYLQREFDASTLVCSKLGKVNEDKIGAFMIPFYDKQAAFHLEVEEVKNKCKDSQTPLDMQDCLAESLYLKYRPATRKLEAETNEVVKKLNDKFEELSNDLKPCFGIVATKLTGDAPAITEGFRKCCLEASQNI